MRMLYLVKVEPGANNNKYYKMIENGDTLEVHYGRIGTTGYQIRTYPISQWDKKLKEKLRKEYVDQTRLVAELTVKPKKEYIDISNTSIASIVSRLQNMARKAIEDNYTISSTMVSQVMIDEAQITLNKLILASDLYTFNDILVNLFKIIPRKMGKVIDYLAKDVKDFADIIQREQDLLDVMEGQVVEQEVSNEDEHPEINKTILEAMGLTFEDISIDDEKIIKHSLGNIKDRYHNAWKVNNLKTQKRFDTFVQNNNISDVRLLFHGSRNENFWSIINSGLLLKPTNAVITGKMFGNGIYYAPLAQKSLGYTSINGSYWAGGNSRSGFMILNDVAYGKPYDVYSFSNKYNSLDYSGLQKMCDGANCLHAHSGNGMLRNDEIIIYKEEKSTIKYLI